MKSAKYGIALYIIFALSGFSGLIYESIWSHYLKLFLGHAAYSQVLVLGIFMGGMGLGAWLTSKIVSRFQNLLLIYAIVEGLIGLCGLGFHSVFVSLLGFSYNTVFPALESSSAVQLYKWFAGGMIILPQSILLGSTFPLMSNGLIRMYSGRSGYSLSMLYFTNSIGASIGVLVSGFYLIANTGLPGTILLAGVLNIFIAVAVYFLARPMSFTKPSITKNAEENTWPLLILVAAFITGAASFIYEIAWIRMLSMVLGASTHAFELMLSAFIFGLAAGSLWIRKRIDRIANPLKLAAIIQICMGMFALLTLPVYNYTFDLMAFFLKALSLTDSGYILFNVTSHFIALIVMLPATICAGMTLPLFTNILLKQGYGERSVGQIYASNTFGAIFGVTFVVLVGLPLFNLKGSMIIGSGLDILLGLVLAGHSLRKSGFSLKLVSPYVAFPLALVLIISFVNLDTIKMTSGVFRHGDPTPIDYQLLYYKDGKTASISITKTESQLVTLKTNGKPDAGISMSEKTGVSMDEYTMVLLGALPVVHHPGAKNAAAIGMGSGLTSHTLLAWPGIDSVDTVEIEPAVVEAARFFRPRVENIFVDPRSNIHIDDARSFFSTHKKTYDIIVSEPSNPWVSGVSSLFTREFYSAIKNYMNPDGLFVQWIHTYEIDRVLLLSVLKALSLEFQDYKIYAPNHADLVILASKDGNIENPDGKVFADNRFARELGIIDIKSLQDLKLRFLGDKEVFGAYIDNPGNVVNSDYFPILDQYSPRTRYLKTQAGDIYSPRYFHLPVLQVLYPWLEENYTEYDANTNFMPTVQLINQAREIFEYTLGKSSKINDKESQYYVDYLLTVSDSCGQLVDRELWVESVFNMMVQTLPYLHPPENLKLHDAILPRCDEEIDVIADSWLNLFLALGDRDEKQIVTVAADMMADNYSLSLPQKRYVISALFLGLIATGEHGKALALWTEHKKDVLENEDTLTVTMAMLLAMAKKAMIDSTGQ